MPLLGQCFSALHSFKVTDAQSSAKLPKIQFLEQSDPLTENFQNFAM